MGSSLRESLTGRWRGSPLARGTAASWLASGSLVVLGALRAKVNAVTLGSAGVGIIGQANYLSTWIGVIATIGLSTGCIRAMAAAHARGSEKDLNAVAHLAILMPLALGVLPVLGAAAFSLQISRSLLGDSSLWWVLVLAALSVPLNLFVGGISTVLQGEEQIPRSARMNAIIATLNTVLVVCLVVTMQLRGAALAVLLTSVIGVGVAVSVAPSAVARALSWPFHFPNRAILAAIISLSMASFLLAIAGTTTDVLIRARVVALYGVKTVGEYQPVFAISNQYLVGFISAIGIYMFPTLTRMLESGNRIGAEKELNAGLRMMLFVFTPCIIFVAVIAPLAVRLLYSGQFAAAVPVLRVQLIGDILKVCAYSLGAVLLPLRRMKWWTGIGIGTVGVNVIIAWILLPLLRLPAIGVAYTASWALNLGLTLLVLLRESERWFTMPNRVLCGAGILSVVGVVTLVTIVPSEISSVMAVVVLAVWLFLGAQAVLKWLKSAREA